MALTPNVIDVPFLLLNQLAPKHAGPIGRIATLTNAQIKKFLPSTQSAPQHIQVEAREAFQSVATTLRSSTTGQVVAGTWSHPEILDSLGEQLLSICDSVPRVFTNNQTWSYYETVRILTNTLNENVVHTTNHVLQAPDSARIGVVTCFTWTETIPSLGGNQYQPMVAFRADDGAWIRTPFAPFSNAPGLPPTMVRVVSDGTRFWVFAPIGSAAKFGIWVYDTHGTQLASDTSTIALKWAVSPGYWDIYGIATGARLIQPTTNTTIGANVGATIWFLSLSGASIVILSTVITGTVAAKCSGPLAFMDPTGGQAGRLYITTLGAANGLYAYEINAVNGAVTVEYSFGAVVGGSGIPDSLTGWIESNVAGPIAHVAYSLLSNFSPPAGPLNDPGLRYTRSYACTSAGVVSLTNQVNGVLLSSRAFKIDQDWYSAVYYQSGGGLTRGTGTTPPTMNDATDYVIGSAVQPLHVNATDVIIGSVIHATATAGTISTGAPATRIICVPSQAIATITHNAGDGAVAATQVWTFLNAAFQNLTSVPFTSAFNSYLRISGSSHAANNHDFRVIQVLSGTTIVTEAVSTAGTIMVDDTLAGVTGVLLSTTTIAVTTEEIGSLIPPGAESYYTGTLATTGFTAPANNTTFTCFRVITNQPFPQGPAATQGNTMFLCTPVGTNVYAYSLPGATVTFSPANVNAWGLFSEFIGAYDIGNDLVVSGTPQNDGPHRISSTTSMGFQSVAVTGADLSTVPQLILPPIPTISLALADPTQAYHMHVASGAFDASYKGAYFTFSGPGPNPGGVWQVVQVLSATDLVLTPVDGRVGIRSTLLSIDTTLSITRTTNQPSATQPCWYLMPLSISQHVAGRWEWGQAYGDWRFDGETKANTGTFERNGFPLALSSIVTSADGLQLTLPYRAQSFTAGQVLPTTQQATGLNIVAQSTIGLKLFNISTSAGQAVTASSEMLLPGMQASQFSSTGFPEDGINLGAEQPFVVSQATVAGPLALTLNTTYQYVVDFEVTSDSGDRVWSTVSPTLDVTLRGTQNKNVIGGRMPGPTNRVVGVAIYRTSTSGGSPTVQHYKITNDLDVNGTGFTFSSVNGGANFDTWQFADTVPDPQILSSEVIYTDRGLLQHFPAPAFSRGVASWQNRTWVIGYDGAIWMSGEKQEGDAIWFHPAFRYFLPTEDKPVALAALDSYLIVFCAHSIWYIPAVQFPDATGLNGSLPTSVQLPFPNGCTGFAKTIRSGAVYSSTAGGIWLITRSLTNLYLSQPIQDDLQSGITGLTVDGQQRLIVSVEESRNLFVYDEVPQAWYKWVVPTVTEKITTIGGNVVYEDDNYVSVYTPGSYTDIVGTVSVSGIAPDVTLAFSEFGNVRGLKAVWACQIVGEYKGYHRLNAVMSYPDETDEPATTFGPFTPDAGKPYIYEINPMVEEATSYGLRLYVDFIGAPGGIPGNSMTLELLSFEVGIEPTMSKVPSAQRIEGS